MISYSIKCYYWCYYVYFTILPYGETSSSTSTGGINRGYSFTSPRIQHADWKEAYVSYEQISKEMEGYQCSSEEVKRIGKLEDECAGYSVKCAVNYLDGL